MATRKPNEQEDPKLPHDAWFCYEKNSASMWMPQIYWGETPPSKGMDGSKRAERSPVVKLYSTDPIFKQLNYIDALANAYPPPKDGGSKPAPKPKAKPIEEADVIAVMKEVEEAAKDDEGKRRFLFPQRALDATNDVFTDAISSGAHKVGNWHQGKGFDWDRLDDALQRHLGAFRLGENIDPKSGLPHLAHAICCLAMLLEHTLTGHGKDTRSRNQHLPEDKTCDI